MPWKRGGGGCCPCPSSGAEVECISSDGKPVNLFQSSKDTTSYFANKNTTQSKTKIFKNLRKTSYGHPERTAFNYYVETGLNSDQGPERSQTLLVRVWAVTLHKREQIVNKYQRFSCSVLTCLSFSSHPPGLSV